MPSKPRYLALLLFLSASLVFAQPAAKPAKKMAKKPAPPFSWVNTAPAKHAGLATHATFRSPSMDADVGYCIYLPPAYARAADRRFPVVYLLHGGRPGNEWKMAGMLPAIDAAMKAGDVPPAIYVLPNGGKVSHYNTPQFNSMGEDVLVKELIPHVDSTYRTLATRAGRAIEGFSQGGRGTARILFRYPQLFCSAAPGGGGYETEKAISTSGGYENEKLFFGAGNNTWDLAKSQANKVASLPKILIYVGSKGFNYENNLAYMAYLKDLGIPFEKLIVPGVAHSSRGIYEKQGLEIMRFHARNFGTLK